MARTTGDIKARVSKGAIFDLIPLSVMGISDKNNKSAEFAGNGYWNDPDMLATGDQGLSIEEQKSHFALWCIMSSPLILGNDPRIMTKEEKEIILNKEAIAINQDPTEQGKRIKVEGDIEIWAKHLKNGEMALLVLNRNNSEKKNFIFKLSEIGIAGKTKIRSVYTGNSVSASKGNISVQIMPHASVFMLVEKE